MLEDIADLITDVLDDEYNSGTILLPIKSVNEQAQVVYSYHDPLPIQYQDSPRKFTDVSSGKTALQPRFIVLLKPLNAEAEAAGITIDVESIDDLGGIIIDRIGNRHEIISAASDPLRSYFSADLRVVDKSSVPIELEAATMSGSTLSTQEGVDVSVHGTYGDPSQRIRFNVLEA